MGNDGCPVCGAGAGREIARRVFRRGQGGLDEFTENIYRFIFEDWLAGREEVEFRNLHCGRCGYVWFEPRPTVNEIARLRHKEQGQVSGCCPGADLEAARLRGEHLRRFLERRIDLGRVQSVLDFGGMDGRLMGPFLAAGKRCCLVDYCRYVMEGVEKIGETIDEVAPSASFDLIVCSHVLEHLVDPRGTVERLVGLLAAGGVLFAEVPMQLWKRPPLVTQREPISHLGFFSPASFANLFELAGAGSVRCELGEYLHGWGGNCFQPALRALAYAGGNSKGSKRLRPSDALEFIKPGIGTYLKFYRANPHRLRAELARRIPGRG